VRQALASAVPPARKVYPRRPMPAIDPYVEVIDSWLLADREVPRKQRHTARRVWQRLVAEPTPASPREGARDRVGFQRREAGASDGDGQVGRCPVGGSVSTAQPTSASSCSHHRRSPGTPAGDDVWLVAWAPQAVPGVAGLRTAGNDGESGPSASGRVMVFLLRVSGPALAFWAGPVVRGQSPGRGPRRRIGKGQ
jgi:hypothetical protein